MVGEQHGLCSLQMGISGQNDIDVDFGADTGKIIHGADLFNEHAAEYSAIELHETDELSETEALKDDDYSLFSDVAPKTGEQGDDI